ncbi:MAG: 23S rRNA (pseudouridine(1915)-N(3))-methyltransferase RlmH [Bryobacteraceae bacterium]|nr:23S rRNA (pseudouridine(1915)-N(3))-methyltransferase RlmH [Bryobacteraceae bacterium]
MQVILYYVGKARDPRANAMAAEFVKRTTRYARCAMAEIDPRRGDPRTRHRGAMKIVLDPGGQMMDSRQFVELVRAAEAGARDLILLVGGADGLPPGWRENADLALSLSPLTLPHELARVILAEQIYRAFATLRGHPYPR